jgi:uncharacterized protein YjcR
MNGFIYKITNKVNNKVYIGQTRFTVESRWRQHIKNYNIEKRKQPLYLAFEKYGLDNFSVETVEEVDVSKLDEREIYWIAKYNSFNSGYNATIGGKGGRLLLWTDSMYEEIRTMYLSGFTTNHIAKKYNVSSWTIAEILKSLNVRLRGNPLNMNAVELEEIKQRYYNGTSLKILAKEYKVAGTTMKSYLISKGVDIKDHSRLLNNEELHKELIKDYTEGMRYRDLEIKYSADTRTIKRILVQHGINLDIYRGLKRTTKGAFCLTDAQCLEVIELYNSKKLKLKDIAKKYKINESTIYSLLEKYGVTYRRHNFSKSVQSLNNGDKMYSNKPQILEDQDKELGLNL